MTDLVTLALHRHHPRPLNLHVFRFCTGKKWKKEILATSLKVQGYFDDSGEI